MSYLQHKTASIAALSAALVLAAMLPATPAAAFGCNLDLTKMKAKVVVANDNIQTTSSSTINVPNMAVHFTSKAGCVFIQFTADVATPTGDQMTIRATIDNNTTGGLPFPVTFTSRGPNIADYSGNSANFIFTNVTAGAHTARITWNTFNAQTIRMGGRSLTVFYHP